MRINIKKYAIICKLYVLGSVICTGKYNSNFLANLAIF